MKIVATQSLGPLGTSASQPAVFPWQWYYHAGGAPLWLVTVLLVVGLGENRHRQGWLILLPLAVLAVVWRMLTRLLAVPDDAAEWFGIVVMSCAVGWAAVWLLGDRLAPRHPVVRFVAALVVMLAVGGLSCLSHLQRDNTEDLLNIAIAHGVSSAAVLLGMMLSGRSCRGEFRRGRFLRLLYGWMALALSVTLCVSVAAVWVVQDAPSSMLIMVVVQCAIMSLVAALGLFLLNLPFLLLAFKCPFYGQRFHALFCPQRPAEGLLET